MLPNYRAESCVLEDPEELSQQWLTLQDQADCSYFLSWGWIGTWLQQIAIGLRPQLVRVWHGDQLVGLAIFVPRAIKRRLVFSASALFLHEYPFDHKNMVIEYNGLLAARGHERGVCASTVEHLLQACPQYDEFHFGAIAEGLARGCLLQAADNRAGMQINEESTAWHVALDALEPGMDNYLATLSKNRRNQLRRSMRLYEQQGPLDLVEAQDTAQALDFFEDLKELHGRQHQLKGEGGAFANPHWEQFHRALIQARFGAAEVQLIRVSSAAMTIGYLYNFVWRKQVYVLQTGFRPVDDKRDLPGYVVHALAIVYNRDKGMDSYDLMHGDDLYKRILCNRSRQLSWMVMQRKCVRFKLENCALQVVRRARRALRR